MALSTEKRKTLAAIRSLIKSNDFSIVQQGLELLSSLNEADLWDVFTDGLSISQNGKIHVSKGEITKRVSTWHRSRFALHAARRSGMLDNSHTLDLSERLTKIHLPDPTIDLRLLGGLPCLRTLLLNFFPWESADSDLVNALRAIPNLHTLHLVQCDHLNALDSLTALGQIPSLRVLELKDCFGLSSFASLESMSNLKRLKMTGCTKIGTLDGLRLSKNVTELCISSWPIGLSEQTSLEDLKNLAQLTTLELGDLQYLSRLDDIQALTHLKELRLSRCHRLGSTKVLSTLTNLQSLTLTEVQLYSVSLGGLEPLSRLTDLNLSGCKKVFIHRPNLPNLRSLNLSGISTNYGWFVDLRSFEHTEGLVNLRRLTLSSCAQLLSLCSLGPLPNLQHLDISNCKRLKSLQGHPSQRWSISERLPDLKELNASGCAKLSSLSGIEGLRNLTRLNLSKCGSLKDISRLKNLPNLTSLNLSKCKSISEFQVLKDLPQLQHLTISKRAVSEDLLNDIRTALPDVQIEYTAAR